MKLKVMKINIYLILSLDHMTWDGTASAPPSALLCMAVRVGAKVISAHAEGHRGPEVTLALGLLQTCLWPGSGQYGTGPPTQQSSRPPLLILDIAPVPHRCRASVHSKQNLYWGWRIANWGEGSGLP
jgi:hypothetical protein